MIRVYLNSSHAVRTAMCYRYFVSSYDGNSIILANARKSRPGMDGPHNDALQDCVLR